MPGKGKIIADSTDFSSSNFTKEAHVYHLRSKDISVDIRFLLNNVSGIVRELKTKENACLFAP